jgi:hypothetical protein
MEATKTKPIPCKGGVEFRNWPLCLISGPVYVSGKCEELDIDILGCVYQLFKVERWEARDGDECQF